MATIQLSADSTFASLGAVSGDTIDLNGYICTIDATLAGNYTIKTTLSYLVRASQLTIAAHVTGTLSFISTASPAPNDKIVDLELDDGAIIDHEPGIVGTMNILTFGFGDIYLNLLSSNFFSNFLSFGATSASVHLLANASVAFPTFAGPYNIITPAAVATTDTRFGVSIPGTSGTGLVHVPLTTQVQSGVLVDVSGTGSYTGSGGGGGGGASGLIGLGL